jgi:hypothetical protein
MKLPSHAKHDVFLSSHYIFFFFLLHYIVSTNQTSVTSNNNQVSSTSSPAVVNNPDSSSIKTTQRRKKGLGHRRNNSKGSVTSWTPPSLSAIADQEQKRASVNIISNSIEEIFPTNQKRNSSIETTSKTSVATFIPSISAVIDSKTKNTSRQLNPKALKLDLKNPINAQMSPTNEQRPSTMFTYALRKSSSSDPEDFDDNQHHNLSRQRRRRNLNLNNNKISSPSSTTIRSIKSTPNTPQIDESENINNHLIDEKNDNDLRKYPRSVSFNLSPSTANDRSPSYQSRKIFNRVN